MAPAPTARPVRTYPSDTGLRRAMLLVALVAAVAAALGIGVRALETAHVAVDEEQYYLSALSLAEDGDLDITDEMAEQRWREFADVVPHVETVVQPDGSQISPHDPLLPIILAVPAGLGGWVAAKATLAGLAGALAALTLWLATRRFGVGPRVGAVGVAVAGASLPLAAYGQQLYPELPAALVAGAGVAAVTGPLRRRELVLLGAVVTALPWLSVKYGLVAFTLAGLGAVRWWRGGQRREVGILSAALAASGVLYLVVHRVVWGGWTVYASGDHFAETGEFAVIGVDPDYVERSLRLAGLLLDHEFGLVPWQPAWLLAVPAVAALAARRPPGWSALAVPLAAGWFVATFVALTMHGYWSPGRQLVVVLPLAVIATLYWLDHGPRWARVSGLVLGLAGVLGYVVFLVQGYLRQVTWVVHFIDADAPVYRLLRPVLTDWRGDYRTAHLAGFALLAGLAALGWRHGRRSRRRNASSAS
ncbi:hypothetical protein ACVGVM_09535 [Pseudonocardia bannensis]|uniref:Glycosyltransferase RgtA/B/C/D-like domain-containing protein n=1 Tax=Pseudonocardia bannensis TaxID=630973 RepID=A0A848DGF5_9PSEU|nr:hypothetical protein [Pseudonocardia bannensis]NMH91613.1 hypothetical protein [Pseudonocardia bannensis]